MGQPAAPARLPVTAAQQGGLPDLCRDGSPGILPVLPDDRSADDPQAVPPLFHLAQGCVPLGQGIIVLDLVS